MQQVENSTKKTSSVMHMKRYCTEITLEPPMWDTTFSFVNKVA